MALKILKIQVHVSTCYNNIKFYFMSTHLYDNYIYMLQFFIKYVGTIKLHVNLLSETNEKKNPLQYSTHTHLLETQNTYM